MVSKCTMTLCDSLLLADFSRSKMHSFYSPPGGVLKSSCCMYGMQLDEQHLVESPGAECIMPVCSDKYVMLFWLNISSVDFNSTVCSF